MEGTGEYSYLGIPVTASNVKFNVHEKFLVGKVLRALGAVKGSMKNSYNRYEIAKLLWTAEVRPLLRYAAETIPLTL